MPHVVTGNLKASAEAPYQAGVHGTEAPEVDRLVQAKPFGRGLHMPMKQIVTIKRLADLVGKNKVIRPANSLLRTRISRIAPRITPCLSYGTSRLAASVFTSSNSLS